jgi:hypothetical protein
MRHPLSSPRIVVEGWLAKIEQYGNPPVNMYSPPKNIHQPITILGPMLQGFIGLNTWTEKCFQDGINNVFPRIIVWWTCLSKPIQYVSLNLLLGV